MKADKTGNYILNLIHVKKLSIEDIVKETGMDRKMIERIRDVTLEKLERVEPY